MKLDPRERAAIEGERIFQQTIAEATGQDQATRRRLLDERIDQGRKRCPHCGGTQAEAGA